jgi:hypothetical protein
VGFVPSLAELDPERREVRDTRPRRSLHNRLNGEVSEVRIEHRRALHRERRTTVVFFFPDDPAILKQPCVAETPVQGIPKRPHHLDLAMVEALA